MKPPNHDKSRVNLRQKPLLSYGGHIKKTSKPTLSTKTEEYKTTVFRMN